MEKLKFGKGNAKLDKKVSTFSLPSGITCPFAKDCKCSVEENTSSHTFSVKVYKDTKFKCFFASLEALYPQLRASVNHNLDLIKKYINSEKDLTDLISRSLPSKSKYFRIHVGGDFFNENYFKAWMNVAKSNKDKIFYAYTKSIPILIKYKDIVPDNFIITCSYGSYNDDLIEKYDLKRAKVYYHPDDAKKDGVEIDHDDSLAMDPSVKKFGLLLHGNQEKGSKAADAIKRLKKEKIKFSYSVKSKNGK